MKYFAIIKSLLVLLLMAGFGYSGLGQIPEGFSIQMLLTDNSGTAVPNGVYNLSVSIYDVPTGGTALLMLDQETVNVIDGLANIVLGGQSGLGLPFDEQYFVGISLDGESEMTPRLSLNPSAYSQSARAVFGTSNVFPAEGNVGIGTLEPTATLDVNGQVRIRNIPEIESITDKNDLRIVSVGKAGPDGAIVQSLRFAKLEDEFLNHVSSLKISDDFAVLDSTGIEVFNVNAHDGTMKAQAFATFDKGLRGGSESSNLFVNADGGFGINNNNDDLFSVNPDGFGTFGGGVRIGLGSSYVNFDQTGRINLFGDNGLAADLNPNGTNFFYVPTSVKNDFFVGGADTSYFVANKDGSFGSVHNGQWAFLLNPYGNSVLNGPLYLNTGMIVGSSGNPYITYSNDGVIWRNAAGENTAQILTDGSIQATSLNVTGEKNFRIDHPLDPENKYLVHRSIESSDRLNLYNGNVTLNKKGEAEVELPAWFGELNEDYRYQLTAIGAPGPNLYIAKKIENNKFKISGGNADMEVSWQVTGKRKDKYANNQPAMVEVLKESPELSAQFKME